MAGTTNHEIHEKRERGFGAMSFFVNGGITVFETRFARASKKQDKSAVS